MELKTLEQHEKEKATIHTFVESSSPRKNGIACPKCGEELWDSNPSIQMRSHPARTHIHCIKKDCNYKGSRTV